MTKLLFNYFIILKGCLLEINFPAIILKISNLLHMFIMGVVINKIVTRNDEVTFVKGVTIATDFLAGKDIYFVKL